LGVTADIRESPMWNKRSKIAGVDNPSMVTKGELSNRDNDNWVMRPDLNPPQANSDKKEEGGGRANIPEGKAEYEKNETGMNSVHEARVSERLRE